MDSSLEMKILFKGKKRIDAEFNGFTVQTDQPVEAGGERLAPGPFDLFLASIGTCAAVFIQSFCEKRKIPYRNIVGLDAFCLNLMLRFLPATWRVRLMGLIFDKVF
jgi:organic hydroperoxide reductase OsmC/OhrA